MLTLEQSLQAQSKGGLNDGGALARLIRAVETFGFHLATLDLRQNADVHARVVGELLRVAGVSPDYGSWMRPRAWSFCGASSQASDCLASPYASYCDETLSELAIVRAAAEAHRALWPGLHHYLHRFEVRERL